MNLSSSSNILRAVLRTAIQIVLVVLATWEYQQFTSTKNWLPWATSGGKLALCLFSAGLLHFMSPLEVPNNWRIVLRRFFQVLLTVFALYWLTQEYDTSINWWWHRLWGGAVLCFVVVWDLSAMSSLGLRLFPDGYGLRTLSQQGSGLFLSLYELATQFRWKRGGIYVGQPLRDHRLLGLIPFNLRIGPVDDRHMLTVAGAGSGKATAAVIPNLLHYPGSALVIDPKGELAQITAARRGGGSERVTRSLGQSVFILDPEDIVDGHPRSSWNPLAELDPNDPHIWGKVAKISLALVPEKSGDQEYWATSARDLLTALLMHIYTTEPPERQNLIYARRLIMQGDAELFELHKKEAAKAGSPLAFANAFEAMLSYMVENPSHGGKISGQAQMLQSLADVTRASVLSQLAKETGFLDNLSMEKTLQRSDFCLADLKLRPTTIYICLKATSMAGPLSKLMYMLLVGCP